MKTKTFKPMSEYAKKLLDPRWQKKRLEVLEAANWSCATCGNDKSTLHVHHKIYLKGREPWDYEVGQLACLCADCHEEQHEFHGFEGLMRVASFAPIDGPGCKDECAMLLAGFLGLPGYEGHHPAMRALYQIGKYAEVLSRCRGISHLPSKEEKEDLIKAIHYSRDDVSAWFKSLPQEND